MAPGITAASLPRRILFLDAYDSFTNNIVNQARESLGVDVTVIHIDDKRFVGENHAAFLDFLSTFDAVIAGPGPGNPSNEPDVGLIGKLWTLDEKHMLPVFGVCLGYQSLALAFGAEIECLPEPRHGVMTTAFLHVGRDIFKDVGEVKATQYHSLRVNIGHSIQTQNSVCYTKQLWESTAQCPELQPLAWNWDIPPNKAVLMALAHVEKPFWGVQYHPESICTNQEGAKVMRNWWAKAQVWNAEHKILRLMELNQASTESSDLTEESEEDGSVEAKDIRNLSGPLRLVLDLARHADAVRSRKDRNVKFPLIEKLQNMSLEPHRKIVEGKWGEERAKETAAITLPPPLLMMSKLQVLEKGYETARLSPEWDESHHPYERYLPWSRPESVLIKTCGSGQLRVSEVCGIFGLHSPSSQAIVLESGLKPGLRPSEQGTGRYSIIGFVIPDETIRLSYSVYSKTLYWKTGHGKTYHHAHVEDIWEYLKELMQDLKPVQEPSGPPFAPFWGGLMGYVSYEAGLDTIEVEPSPRQNTNPDLQFALITRSIVMDHVLRKIYIQSIRSADDMDWVFSAHQKITTCLHSDSMSRRAMAPVYPALPIDPLTNMGLSSVVEDIINESAGPFLEYELPTERNARRIHNLFLREQIKRGLCSPPLASEYKPKVSACQSEIAAGNSYELCLTQQTPFTLPALHGSESSLTHIPWTLFRNIMTRNPAPFAAYLNLAQDDLGTAGVSIVSSSPERFMSWDRKGRTQCRPIKGTVRKSPDVTRAHAESILQSSKERAENLMIVDLTRHQLHGVFGSNVSVPLLMEVEEYETVYQLVSVVEGAPLGVDHARTPEEWEEPRDYVSVKKAVGKADTSSYGIRALAASLPPGSMTGAPKKRSCELLKDIEGDVPRGVYAGVLGYLDVGGGGDFSVVIRTAVRWQSERTGKEGEERTEAQEVWRIGAGGAITSQSAPEGEYEEMGVKLSATLGAFAADPGHRDYPME